MLKKVVIVGPESTGKSTLAKQLAAHFKTTWVPEYAREYLLKHGMNYTYEDLLTIAKGQIELEEIMARDAVNELIFIDTDMYVMKVWCEVVFGDCHSWILNRIAERKYDLYLLCKPDLPWVRDELREYPDLSKRLELYKIYHATLVSQKTAFVEIGGDYQQRLQAAIDTIEKIK